MTKDPQWLPISGYETRYSVSNFGQVISNRSGKLLRQIRDSNGYLRVQLCKPNHRQHHRVHRLVLSAFLRPPKQMECCNHLNANKSDNRIENLEWVTHLENMKHARLHGLLIGSGFGESNHASKLNRLQASIIRHLRGRLIQAEIANFFSISPSAVSLIQLKKTWTAK